MRVAIVHDWLVTYAGAERVLEQMILAFPDAKIFAVVDFLDDANRNWLKNKKVKTTFIQKMPFARSKYRAYLPLMPSAIEQFDLSSFDLILSSSHAVAKGVLTGPDQLHICFCHSPIRYAWDLQHQYLLESKLEKGFKSLIARWVLHKLRLWDNRTSNGVDHFIANSRFISRRIYKTYRRESTVIYPSVDTEKYIQNKIKREDFYVTCSRMVPYKKIDLIVETFTKKFPEKKLVVIGHGPDFEKITNLAGDNVKFTGRADFKCLHKYLSSARAFIFAAEEDFGIAPVEAHSCGTPVIAYAKGGALETVTGLGASAPTGVFFDEQSVESLTDGVRNFEKYEKLIAAENCRKNALRFSEARFQKEFKDFVLMKYKIFKENS